MANGSDPPAAVERAMKVRPHSLIHLLNKAR